uniref:Uncharacterized protein n=1 Tax=Oryza nivara TaxID=4536 RepID=A0A0E0GPG0_ORYNI
MVTGNARTTALSGGGRGDTARRQGRRPAALGQPGGGQGDPREHGSERKLTHVWLAAARNCARRRRKQRGRRGRKRGAGDWGGCLGWCKGSRGGWWREELAREEPTAADCDGGNHRRARKGIPRRSGGARFTGVGVSTRGRELVPPVERTRAAPREAGAERRPPEQSKSTR